MRVAFLTAGNSRSAGGLFYTITSVTKLLFDKGIEISVIGHNDKYSQEDKQVYGNVPLLTYNRTKLPILKTLGYSPDINHILDKYAPQIIHQQGIWMYHSYAALRYKRTHPETILIVEPHGMLDPWAVRNSAWKKKIVGHLFEYNNLHNADCIHALCQSEYESIRNFGLKNPIAIIPNGVNLPNNLCIKHSSEKKILLYIGRIHPKKGLKELILAIAIVKKKRPNSLKNWELHIAGWDQNGHINELKQLVDINDLNNNVIFLDPLYGDAKENALNQANAFILPSFSEGLPMSVLEAWAHKLPVIMTEFCNLPEGFNSDAAFRISPTPQGIANVLIDVFCTDKIRLDEIGNNGYNLVKHYFTWESVANQTIKLYKCLLYRGIKPDFVYE